jgi:hypothetical protein
MSIAKIDIDIKMDDNLLEKFIQTRKAIIQKLGYTYITHNITKTEKGYHIWFKIKEKLNDKDLCDLQFLLGDDQTRCKFNYLRLEAGCFRQFNVLFSKKFKGNQNNYKNVEKGKG